MSEGGTISKLALLRLARMVEMHKKAMAQNHSVADMDLVEQGQGRSVEQQENDETHQVIKRGKVTLTPLKAPAQPAKPFADADFKEPSGPAHITLREEKFGLLLVNRLTGKMSKVAEQELTPEEMAEVNAPHGAGPLDSPDRQHTNVEDVQLAKSDENSKTNIHDGGQPVNHFLDQLQAHQYEYKNPKDGKGTHFSVMAQELEKAGPVGKSMVINTPDGKKVDYARGLGVFLASAAMLNDRQNEMQKVISTLQKSIKNKKGSK